MITSATLSILAAAGIALLAFSWYMDHDCNVAFVDSFPAIAVSCDY